MRKVLKEMGFIGALTLFYWAAGWPANATDGLQTPDAAQAPSGDSALRPAETQYPAAQESLPPLNAALKYALEARFGPSDPLGLLHWRERDAIAAFYAARDFAPL
jgi:hypothetical protein